MPLDWLLQVCLFEYVRVVCLLACYCWFGVLFC